MSARSEILRRYGRDSLPLLFLLFIGITFFLLARQPLLLAPPYTLYSVIFYLGLLLGAWLLVAFLFYRSSARKPWLLAVIASLLMSCCWCTILAPGLPMPEIFLASFTCEEESLGGGRVRYTCTRQALEERTIFIMEGREGLPIVWLVDREFTE